MSTWLWEKVSMASGGPCLGPMACFVGQNPRRQAKEMILKALLKGYCWGPLLPLLPNFHVSGPPRVRGQVCGLGGQTFSEQPSCLLPSLSPIWTSPLSNWSSNRVELGGGSVATIYLVIHRYTEWPSCIGLCSLWGHRDGSDPQASLHLCWV